MKTGASYRCSCFDPDKDINFYCLLIVSSSSERACELPFDLLPGFRVRVCISRFRENALSITSPMINRTAIPEAIRTVNSQPGAVRVGGAVEKAGTGVVTIASWG